jgi:hypothetical protein
VTNEFSVILLLLHKNLAFRLAMRLGNPLRVQIL